VHYFFKKCLHFIRETKAKREREEERLLHVIIFSMKGVSLVFGKLFPSFFISFFLFLFFFHTFFVCISMVEWLVLFSITLFWFKLLMFHNFWQILKTHMNKPKHVFILIFIYLIFLFTHSHTSLFTNVLSESLPFVVSR